MNKLAVFAIIVGLLTALGSTDTYGDSGSDYWPTWRGPDATGAARKGNPPLTWSKTENIKWKVKLPGQGTSSPVIWSNRIFFLTAIETDKEGLPVAQNAAGGGGGRPPFHSGRPPKNVYKFDIVCLDRKTGRLLWQKTAREELPHEGHYSNYGGFASYSPITDGKYVWASFGSRGVHCYDIDGNHKWRRDLGKMRKKMMFGEGSSPALAGDVVIVVLDHEGESFICALNKETGKTIWKKGRDETTS